MSTTPPTRSTNHRLPCRTCGNVWFDLVPGATFEGVTPVAAVTFAPDGSVSAYSGDIVCEHCGRLYTSTSELMASESRPALRLVAPP